MLDIQSLRTTNFDWTYLTRLQKRWMKHKILKAPQSMLQIMTAILKLYSQEKMGGKIDHLNILSKSPS